MKSESKPSLRAPKGRSNLFFGIAEPVPSPSLGLLRRPLRGLLAMTGRGIFFGLLAMTHSLVFADTVYLKNGTTDKGLVVEEYYDRFLFSTPDGEKEVLKSHIDEVFFDEPYQNNLYIGRRFEDEGDFENALKFYRLALQSNPDFREAKAAMRGLEDAKWRFGKSWPYRGLKETLKAQLGIGLKEVKGKIIIDRGEADLLQGDRIISCWAKPLTYAGLKNASRLLTGLPNTILNVDVEREVSVGGIPAFNLRSLISPIAVIRMEFEGPVIKELKEQGELYKAGLRAGDLIVAVDNRATRYMKLNDVYKGLLSRSNKLVAFRRKIAVMRRRAENHRLTNAMWVWHSRQILLNGAKREELLRFCNERNINLLFFQLQYRFIDGDAPRCRILYETRLRTFLREAHSRGMKVYALDGAPEFCLESRHPLVLAQVAALLDFNKKVQQAERFDGIHYDNEPYLLPGFHTAAKRDIINQFLDLNRKCRDLITSANVKFDFGIDIPFWFDELERLDKKLIDICTHIGIMDYRNFASGPDGIITHALNELRYASEVGKKVFVGVETSRYPAQEVYFVAALNEEELNNKRMDSTRFEDFQLMVHYDEKRFYIGLVKPETADANRFQEALSKLQAQVGKIARPADSEAAGKFISNALFAISTNPEFVDTKPQEYLGEDGRVFLMFVAKEVMLQKITFAGLTEAGLNSVLAEAKKEFDAYPSFAGFAIHHYRSYKELVTKRKH